MTVHAITQEPGAEKASGFCIAKLKEDTYVDDFLWHAGTMLTRNGEIIVWDMQYVKGDFKDKYEWIPVACMNPRFTFKEVKWR